MKKSIAFSFVLDELFSIHPTVKSMFGCHAIYQHEKIVLITRNKEEHKHDNGVWLATTHEHHASLKHDFPSMRSIQLFGTNDTAWQNIPSDADDFEENVLKACALILKGDKRIGKIPKAKKRKKS
ncbi:MAG: hypothetical protein JNK44_18215 [Cyclobacteriaceae bacterium]|nr:hypothetical protein [Cyclobacteriaceae bacterium]